MEPSFELFDHTADVGLRIRAETLAGLIAPAGRALYAAIGDLIPGPADQTFRFEGGEEDAAVLLRDYLDELLALFESSGRLVVDPQVAVFEPERLAVTGGSAAVDQQRSSFHREVKAITYHELAIREVDGGFEATVIVDI